MNHIIAILLHFVVVPYYGYIRPEMFFDLELFLQFVSV